MYDADHVPSRTRAEPSKIRPARRRRMATEARQAILDAAEKRLIRVGPAGIRLQEIAADVGVSHSNVLHHFGNRGLLVKAVITRALAEIHQQIIEAVQASTGEEAQLAALLDAVFDALSRTGHARVLMWLALEGHRIEGAEVRLDDVIDVTHAMRKAKRPPETTGPWARREDTAHTVVLGALALVGSAVMGPTLFENAGLGGDAQAGARFRRWLARLMVRHLESPG
jgi:AcrR family transcriptional regulator